MIGHRLLWHLMLLSLGVQAGLWAQWDTISLNGLRARSIGPAGMSGRITSIDAVADDPNVIFVGSATGGLWKSVNGGIKWKAVFDQQPVASIGAVAVCQAYPSLVWVGTGEAHTRNSAGLGNGVYKSLDGGESWRHMGLDKTEKIHDVLIDPTDPDVVYVSALGSNWGENSERGVFKTTDGGRTWKKVLFVDNKTGCASLVMDPKNPNKLVAAMWEHRRWPWFFKSGGPGSGLYITQDGGEVWKKVSEKDGLPAGELGRIGLAIAASNPDILYALVEAEKSALLRSDDGGRSWKKMNDSPNIHARPFYFSDIYVDPDNENRLYMLHYEAQVSIDRGKTFETMISWGRLHGDHHALWINPKDSRLLINGNDGGVGISHDRGGTWRFVENLPLSQFYHISVDMETPYNIYGGLQDNGSWRGPSSVWESGGIRNYHWQNVGYGDGFGTLSDPQDADVGYSMSQGGYLYRFNLKTSEVAVIRPPEPDSLRLRFNWNSGIAVDPFVPSTIYYGSQFVHKSTDRGQTWTIISPDLTTNDTSKQHQDQSGGLTIDASAAENHCTILSISPSRIDESVLWVGTDDGQVQVTRDGGATWENVTSRIPKLPKGAWCQNVKASKFDGRSAFVVFNDHRRNNWLPYVFKTMDFGKTWTSLTTNAPKAGGDSSLWAVGHVIEQDHVNPDLLFLGTEFGLYVTLDGGKLWRKWTAGVPSVPVHDLVIHPRENDLVIGTHGRGVFVVDDIGALRNLAREGRSRPIQAYEIPTTIQYQSKTPSGYFSPGDAFYIGDNETYGAPITYNLDLKKISDSAAAKDKMKDGPGKGSKIKIEVTNNEGRVIRKMEGPMEDGLNRVYWDLMTDPYRLPKLKATDEGGTQGVEILPGIYTITLKTGKLEASQKVEVIQDPRYSYSGDSRRQKYDAIQRLVQRIEVVTEAVNRIQKTQTVVQTILDQCKDSKDTTLKELATAGDTLKKSIKELRDKLIEDPDMQGFNDGSEVAMSRLRNALWFLGSTWDAPASSHMNYLRQAEALLERRLGEFNRFFSEDVAAFEKKVQASKFSFFPETSRLDVDWKKKD